MIGIPRTRMQHLATAPGVPWETAALAKQALDMLQVLEFALEWGELVIKGQYEGIDNASLVEAMPELDPLRRVINRGK